jgi:hypothetical protein
LRGPEPPTHLTRPPHRTRMAGTDHPSRARAKANGYRSSASLTRVRTAYSVL